MQNNSIKQPEELTLEECKRLQHELHDFKQTFLYEHLLNTRKELLSQTVDGVIDMPLEGLHTVFTRESWIGEARALREMINWFELLSKELENKIRELNPN